TGIGRWSTLGWAKRRSNLVSTSPPGSVLESATRTYGARTARWSRLKLSTFIFLTGSIMRDVLCGCRRSAGVDFATLPVDTPGARHAQIFRSGPRGAVHRLWT